jgi:hypothetical protein
VVGLLYSGLRQYEPVKVMPLYDSEHKTNEDDALLIFRYVDTSSGLQPDWLGCKAMHYPFWPLSSTQCIIVPLLISVKCGAC